MSKVDYSKWDNIELSDDEDQEVHPNIDKASFIRWKQADIHRKREERKMRIAEYKQERETNFKLLDMLVEFDGFSGSVRESKIKELFENVKVYERDRKAILLDPQNENFMKVSGINEVFSMLISRLAEESKISTLDQYLSQLPQIIHNEIPKLENRQNDLKLKIEEEEKEQNKKLTSENMYKEGFSKTILNKQEGNKKGSMIGKEKSIEVLNPNFMEHQKQIGSAVQERSARKKDEEGLPELSLEEERVLLKFIKAKTFDDAYEYIKDHSEVINAEYSDYLMARGFKKQLEYAKAHSDGFSEDAKQSIRYSLVINYCIQLGLGSDGVGLFFRRMQGSAAREVFEQDFHQTWDRVLTRCGELAKKEKSFDESNSNLTKEQSEVFKSFPKDFQEAFISGDMNKINESFTKMGEKKAAEVMETCQKVGLISLLSEEEAKKLVEDEEKGKESDMKLLK